MAQLRIYGLVGDTIVDGPGLRFGVFVQGCTHACPGCHNPESQPADGGALWDVDAVLHEIVANKLVRDVTISGGEPFEQAAACADLAEACKARGYGIWTYTGYLYEDLFSWTGERGAAARRLLDATDVLVDGPFIEARKSHLLHWCGSSNQRLIDLAAMRARDAAADAAAVPSAAAAAEAGAQVGAQAGAAAPAQLLFYKHADDFPERPVAW